MNNAASLAGEGFLLQRKSPWILHLLAGGTAIPGCPLVLSLLVAGRVTLAATLSFRAKQADFFFRIRSCECVGLRRETSAPSRAVCGMKSLCSLLFIARHRLPHRYRSFCTEESFD